MEKKRIHAIVHGRVQGVFFREYTRRKAQELGLSGWVRNLPDSTVETVFQGEPQAVEKMVAWLHEGSPMARVTRVEHAEETPEKGKVGFEIRF